MNIDRVPLKQIEKIRRVYVSHPALHPQALKILTGNYVLVLFGAGSMGKLTAALHLLHERYVNEIFDISPNVDLDHSQTFLTEERRGYIVENLGSTVASSLNASTLRRLSSRLQAHQSRMIITINNRVQLDPDALGEYMLTWDQPLDRNELLHKHLAWYLGDQDLRADAVLLCNSLEVQAALANRSPAQIDRLAEHLARHIRNEIDLEHALKPFLEDLDKQTHDWFAAHKQLEERSLMLAVAVFHGGRYSSAFEADRRLQALIKPATEESKPKSPLVFDATCTETLEAVRAHLVRTYEQSDFGPLLVERVHLHNPDLQSVLLNYAWREYTELRDTLLKWLRPFGFSNDWDVSSRAAAAIGELSKHDFGLVYEEVVLPWAKNPNSYARTSAAIALGILAWDDQLDLQILALLHQWSNLRDNWRLCWTAALTYGLLAGQRFPIDALKDLHTIAETKDWRLFDVVSRSVTSLFQVGHAIPAYYDRVILALDTWIAEAKAVSGAATWLYIFLRIADEVTSRPQGSSSWPTLLWLSALPSHNARICNLWRRALNNGISRGYAIKTLRHWMDTADNMLDLRAAISQLVLDLFNEGNENERARLVFYLDRWATDPGEHSETAGTIRALVVGSLKAKEVGI